MLRKNKMARKIHKVIRITQSKPLYKDFAEEGSNNTIVPWFGDLENAGTFTKQEAKKIEFDLRSNTLNFDNQYHSLIVKIPIEEKT